MATAQHSSSGGGWSQPTVRPASSGTAGHRREPTAPQHPGRAAPAAVQFTLVQLVLLQIAAAAVVCGLAAGHGWRVVGLVVAVLLAAVTLVRQQRRWLYQALTSRARLYGRKHAQRRSTGLASLAGPYQIVDVASSGGNPIAAIRAGTTWALPLEVRQDSVFNDDAAVPLGGLASLLQIEDVPLASVRLLTVATPVLVPAAAPPSPTPLLARTASRYCILTLDTMRAARALADRGGSEAAIAQVMRRCAMRAQEVLASGRVSVHTLDGAAAQRILDSCLGPAIPPQRPADAATVESARGIRVGGTYSASVVVGGNAAAALGRLSELLAYLPGQVSAASLVLAPARHRGGPRCTLLVRASAPADRSAGSLGARLRNTLGQAGLTVQRIDGEQAGLLRASTPLGLTDGPV